MKRNSIIGLGLTACAVLLAGCGEVQDTRPGQPVAHRRAAFSEILRTFEPMGVMLRDDRYDPEKFNALAASFATKVEAPWLYFQPDTNYPPTKARAEVWSQAGRFTAARAAFLQAQRDLSTAAASGNEAKVRAAYRAVEDQCRKCHEVFKLK